MNNVSIRIQLSLPIVYPSLSHRYSTYERLYVKLLGLGLGLNKDRMLIGGRDDY
jgi:hypothetical protein